MKLLLWLCTVTCTILGHTVQARRVVRTYRVREFPDNPPDAPLTMNITLVQDKTVGSYLNGYFHLTRDIGNIQLKLELTRCQIREAPDTCETFNMNPSNTCMFFNMDKTAWSSFFKNIAPEFKCPLKKGTYLLKNGYIDMDFLQMVPIDSYYNTLNYRIFEKKRMIASLCSEFRILNLE